MTQYINKATVVAEIEKRIKETESMQPKFDQFWAGQISAFKGILKILDILEVKEVDLEKEIELIKGDYEQVDVAWNNDFDFIARHFYELGLKTQKGE